MSQTEYVDGLLDFLKRSPSAFHACDAVTRELAAAGFSEIAAGERFRLVPGGKYYVTKNHSAVIAFTVPGEGPLPRSWKGVSSLPAGFQIIASHLDSPMLKVKENPEVEAENAYVRINVEKYGGLLLAPWFDRPLSVAGRMLLLHGGQVEEVLVNVDRDFLVIPSLAIHMNREANEGIKYSVQKELLPLYSSLGKDRESVHFLEQVLQEGQKSPENGTVKDPVQVPGNTKILGHDLFVYNRTPGTVWGAHGEFLSAPRLDDLMCAYGSLQGFLEGTKKESFCVLCILDNEEVGSTTKQGAAGPFLSDTLRRICLSLGGDEEDYYCLLEKSFLVSADNAHAVHPNYPEKADLTNRPKLNQGIVLKYHANQKYCTDGVSAARFKALCEKEGIPVQSFVNHSDQTGGSTLGNIANTKLGISAVDIGLPQLAMHSPYETAGTQDLGWLVAFSREFYR